MPPDLTPSEVARRLGTSTRTVQRWIVDGRIPARRVGGRWRVAYDAFVAFERGLEDAGVADAPAVAASGGLEGPVFIANRGEIAARIARTCDRLGIPVVVPPTDGPDALDLLDPQAVVARAVTDGARFVHPGFGFLAENADFAERVIAAGIVWVGPPPDAIRAMGDKAAARRLATSLGVPTLPGYDDPDQSDAALTAAARRIGYPLLIKPSAGGGGKGMRTVRDPDALDDHLAAARREARAAFGDDRLILERLVEGGRHIEIQVLFDAFGQGVALGERDCSIQRRHQKVFEESPGPSVDAALRASLEDSALRLAASVGYVGAGTCEFLVDERGTPAFLEMNTRLQVEHPITELVTGRDLVADQLRIAAGEPLGFGQGDVRATGHAVEVRLYAEDAEAGFLPQTGTISALRWPTGDGIRVDAGVDAGTVVGGRFDPMLAKVIAWGPDRGAALDRLRAALDDTVVLGLVTNLRFLRWLVREPVVVGGLARTDTLDRSWPPDDWSERTSIPDATWAMAARALAAASVAAPRGADPWSGGWRLNGPARVTLDAEGIRRSMAVPVAEAAAPGPPEPIVVRSSTDVAVAFVDVDGRSVEVRLAPPPSLDRSAARGAATGADTGGPVEVTAPMPGAILSVHVAVGAVVAAGDPLVTIEAMKMEHVVAAPSDGTVADVTVATADQVVRGQALVTLT